VEAGYEGRYELFPEDEDRMDEGGLMAYYALTEAQYEKVMECLKGIGNLKQMPV
jgi:hypothetical protein